MSYADAVLKLNKRAVGIYYEWTTNAHTRDDGYCFYSPTFFAEPVDNTKWRISVHFSSECVAMGGLLQRCFGDEGPELVTVNLLLYLRYRGGVPKKTFSIGSKVFRKGQEEHFELEGDAEVLSDISSSGIGFCCEIWKSGVVTATARDGVRSLTKAISNLWKPSAKVRPTLNSPFEPDLEVEEFWSARMEPVDNTGAECKVLMYAGVTVFDADASSVIGMEEKYFTFRHENQGERDIIRNIVDRGLLKKCLPTPLDGDDHFIERLVARLKETISCSAVCQCRQQCADVRDGTTGAAFETVPGHGDYDLHKNDSRATKPTNQNQANEDLHQTQIIRISSKRSPEPPKEEDDDEFSIESALFRAYRDGLLCDVTVRSGDRTWPAHRVILSTRSAILCKMLNSQACCTEPLILDLSDVEPSVVDAILTFCYSDQLSEEDLSPEKAEGLYLAARRFHITPLLERSSRLLENNLSVLNACRTYVMADACRDVGLKASALDFVISHASEILRSKAWLMFMNENSTAAAQIMYFLILQKYLK